MWGSQLLPPTITLPQVAHPLDSSPPLTPFSHHFLGAACKSAAFKNSFPPHPCPPKLWHHCFLMLSSPVLYSSLLCHPIQHQNAASHHSPLPLISLEKLQSFLSQHNHHLQRHGRTYYHLSELYVSLKKLQLQEWFFRIVIAATCVCNYIIKRKKGRSQSGKRLSKHLREEYSQVISSYRLARGIKWQKIRK